VPRFSYYPSGSDAEPRVPVIFYPWGEGGSAYQTEALVDSGSAPSWVPAGVPFNYAWTAGLVDPLPIRPLGGPARNAVRYLAHVEVNGYRYTLPVCEHFSDGAMQQPIIGRDFLARLAVLFNGPESYLELP
jgi:hypothetical protein